MSNPKLTVPALSACAVLLASCATSQPDLADADIANIAGIEDSFGPPFTVSTVGPAAIDPRLLGPQTLPEGLTFDPADCGKLANERTLPPDVQGNMAATTAVLPEPTGPPIPIRSGSPGTRTRLGRPSPWSCGCPSMKCGGMSWPFWS